MSAFIRNSTIIVVMSCSWIHSTIIYVPQDKLSIQAGIDAASDGDTVLVEPGIYNENIVLDNRSIVVGSHFLITQDIAFIHQTIIDGNNKGRVVKIQGSGNDSTIFCGFTIRHGLTDFGEDGGGVYCVYSSPLLSHLVIQGNSASGSGGGISCYFANPTLKDITLLNNQAIHKGGGVSCVYSSPTLTSITIEKNSAKDGGGIGLISYSSPILYQVTLNNNSAEDRGGGIYLQDSDPVMEHSILHGNTSQGNGAGVFCMKTIPRFSGCVIDSNSGNFGIYVESGDPSIQYSNIYANEKGEFYGTSETIGFSTTTNFNNIPCDLYYNIQLDPQFVNPETGDFHLKLNSPCIDAGDPTAPLGFNGSISDMGVYESRYGRPKPNVPPTLSVVVDTTFLEDFQKQFIPISGIGSGAKNEIQELHVSAISSNKNIIPDPIVVYTSPDSTGMMQIVSIPDAFGTVTITVKITDDGGVEYGGIDSVFLAFTISILPVNDPPSISSINDVYLLESSGEEFINIFGIGSGAANEIQGIVVSAISNNPQLIPDPKIEYDSPDSIATLTIIPYPDISDTTVIRVGVKDDGGIDRGGIDSVKAEFKVFVKPVNNPPTINVIQDIIILEDSEEQHVQLSGIGPGAVDEIQTLEIITSSSNPEIIPDPKIKYSSPDSSGILIFRSLPDAYGTTVIKVRVKDDGGTFIGGIDTVETMFEVTVSQKNDPPTINPVNDVMMLEDMERQTIQLSGIGTGAINEFQTLTIISISDNLDLLPNPKVNYTNPDSTGLLMFTPNPNAYGTATIKIIVRDDGGTDNDGIDSVEVTFLINVTPVNDRPTISRVEDLYILEDHGFLTVGLSQIGPGVEGEVQTLMVSAISDNHNLLPDPVIDYTSPNSEGLLICAPNPETNGEVKITVKVSDDGGIDNGGVDTIVTSFSIMVSSVNDSPELSTFSDIIVLEDCGEQAIPIRGIGTGASDEVQELTIIASSYDHNIIPDPTITYTSPDSTGILIFSPVSDGNGTTLIRVKISDNGGIDSGGIDTLVTTFAVIVSPVNDPPSIETINDITIDEDTSTELFLRAFDIDNDVLSFFSPSDTNSIITQVDNDTIVLTPIKNWNGSNLISVYVSDRELLDTTSFTLHITPVNDPPILEAIKDVTINEDSSSTIILKGNDIDGDKITFSAKCDTIDVLTKVSLDTLLLIPLSDWNGETRITAYVSDGALLDTNSFDLSVLPVNDSPMEFSLLTPLNRDSLFLQLLEFSWHMSTDQDEDTIEYIFSLSGANFDTMVQGLIRTTFSFDGRDFLPSDTTILYTWFVKSTDGIDTVDCLSEFTFCLGGEERIYSYSSFPDKITLHQNQPNPFNTITTIQYDIPEVSTVNLVIYDLLGHRVKTLVNQMEEPGFKSVTWDGTGDSGRRVSAGVYIYHIKAGDFMQTRKMLLLK